MASKVLETGTSGGSGSDDTMTPYQAVVGMLKEELAELDGIQGQNPDTGADLYSGNVYVSEYTPRLFGAPFQLLDSVDRRFPDVNRYCGTEYLRNFIMNSAILSIKPGMPLYTGGAKSNELVDAIREAYVGTATGAMDAVESYLTSLASDTIFKSGAKLQKRMFGFRETYWQYMSYVNYMCRSIAVFLNLVDTDVYPTGTFVSSFTSIDQFETMEWQNYRMLASSEALRPSETLSNIRDSTILGVGSAALKSIVQNVGDELSNIASAGWESITNSVASMMTGNSSMSDAITDMVSSVGSGASQTDVMSNVASDVGEANQKAKDSRIIDVLENKACSVMFMVEPVRFEERLSNTTEPSGIENAIDAIDNGIGDEIAFITGSNVDFGTLEGLSEFLGTTAENVSGALGGLVNKLTGGGFVSNLFAGAVNSIKGQKMIYPNIYKKSESSMDYTFTVNLSSPYGDVYNYYMNIVVPLMHLIALAAPRMVTANSVSSPFLVQAYIPGMCTCELGIISNMQIRKNPSGKHVSVNGFPLDVQVEFTIQELYNAMSISPANDPASFLFNETLNNYMANMAGLIPSVETYSNQRAAMFGGLENYFEQGEWKEDFLQNRLEQVNEFVNPFARNGS